MQHHSSTWSESTQGPSFDSEELVVLVDEFNGSIGAALKSEVHHGNTPLHRGFSVFLFDDEGRLLLQRRAPHKVTWPNFWSNSCCGHELPGESVVAAAARRILFELGVDVADLRVVLPNYRYRAEYAGIVENEFCPVLVGRCPSKPEPNPSEVSQVRWTRWENLLLEMDDMPDITPWCREEARLLQGEQTFTSFLVAR